MYTALHCGATHVMKPVNPAELVSSVTSGATLLLAFEVAVESTVRRVDELKVQDVSMAFVGSPPFVEGLAFVWAVV